MMQILPAIISRRDSLLTDLVAWWSLDEESGTRFDAHGNNDLTDNNTVTFEAGKQGNAAQFAAANDEYLTRSSGHGLLAHGRDITIATWAYLTSKAAPRFIAVVANSNVLTNNEWRLYYTTTTDRFIFDIPTAGSSVEAVANNFGSPSLDTWYLVLASYENATGTVSIEINNGTLDQQTGAIPQNQDSTFYMGKWANLAQRWNGRLDEFAFWGRLLSADEKSRLYNSGNGMGYPG